MEAAENGLQTLKTTSKKGKIIRNGFSKTSTDIMYLVPTSAKPFILEKPLQ